MIFRSCSFISILSKIKIVRNIGNSCCLFWCCCCEGNNFCITNTYFIIIIPILFVLMLTVHCNMGDISTLCDNFEMVNQYVLWSAAAYTQLCRNCIIDAEFQKLNKKKTHFIPLTHFGIISFSHNFQTRNTL